MALPRDGRPMAADQEIEVGAASSLLDVRDVHQLTAAHHAGCGPSQDGLVGDKHVRGDIQL